MSDNKPVTNWDYTVDILVVGSGGGAMAAAVCAHDRGAKTLLIEKELLPQPLIGNYALPDYPMAAVPSEAQFADVLAWAQEKGLVTGDLAYTDSVTPAFLP